MIPQLRPKQQDAVEAIRIAIRDGHRSLLLCAPARSGKTTIFSYITDATIKKEMKRPAKKGELSGVLIVAARRKLIKQASNRLRDYGINHGIIMANDSRHRPHLKVQVASLCTLRNRPEWMNKFKLIIIDEAHACASNTYKWLIDNNPNAYILGFTATPFRADGKPLGKIFGKLIKISTVEEQIDQGYLVPYRVFAPYIPDVSGIDKTMGDYDKDQAAALMDKPKLVGDILDQWLKHARNRKTIIYAQNVKHSHNIVAKFKSAGIKCEHIDAKTHKKQLEKIEHDFEFGDLQVVSNVGMWHEGVDFPGTSCVIAARLTRSRVFYIQAAMRGMGAYDDSTIYHKLYGKKHDMILLDHAGWTLPPTGFGSLYDQEIDELSREDLSKKKSKSENEEIIRIIRCPDCFIAHRPSATCPECGHVYEVKQIKLEIEDGELKELNMEEFRKKQRLEVKKAKTLEELKKIETERGYKKGWAENQLKFKYIAREKYIKKYNYDRFGIL